MISIWERLHFTRYDFLIIGGGITGLSAGISIKEMVPKATVAILEKGLFPSGASTKNAGFACFGSISEIADDLSIMSEEEVVSLVKLRVEGLELLLSRLGKKQIDYQLNGGYELFTEEDTAKYGPKLTLLNDLLLPVFKQQCFSFANNEIRTFGFNAKKVKSLVRTDLEGQLNTGKMMRALQTLGSKHCISYFTNTEVTAVEENGQGVEVHTNRDQAFSCQRLLVANNGFASGLFPNLTIAPGRGLVLATEPIQGLKIRGTFHLDRGYFYFRNLGDRLILGGGRNLDKEAETTTDHGINQKIHRELVRLLDEVIIPGQKYTVSDVWTGIMGFGPTKEATVKQYSDKICAAVGLGGMGVAIGSVMGKRLAELALENY